MIFNLEFGDVNLLVMYVFQLFDMIRPKTKLIIFKKHNICESHVEADFIHKEILNGFFAHFSV